MDLPVPGRIDTPREKGDIGMSVNTYSKPESFRMDLKGQ